MTNSGSSPTHTLHVCMLMPSFYPIVGGMETQVERLIPFLREEGVEATVVTRQTAGATGHETHNTVRIRRLPVLGGAGLRSISFTTLGTLHALRHRRRYDVLHAHSIMSPTTVAAVAGLLTHTPTVVTLHATFEPERLLTKPLGATRLHWYGRHINRFVAINDDITAFLRTQDVTPARIATIPNGIDTAQFRPATAAEREELRAQLGLPGERPLALFVGRLDPVKQVDVLLRAWHAVPEAELVILGDGVERDALERLADSELLRDRVRFAGMQPNVADYLRAADVFVLPSRSEGLSVALLEAMASGCVPVATAVGGAPQLIDSGHNGLLVEPSDANQLAQALSRALSDDSWRIAAATLAVQTVQQRYDLRVVARELADLYRSLARS